MAKFILTSRYIKNPAFSNAGKLLQYMATRDGVEKLPKGIDNKPATKQQEKLIKSIAKNFPETKKSIEFEDYENEPTKANASEFLSYFEENYADKAENMKGLVRYFAERPGVEKLGSHGLFSQTDDKINLDEVADEVSNHDGVVGTHVLSLRREDAERLGYNNAKAWKTLVRRNVATIAEAHNTSDPFELMDALDIHCESSNLEHLKGYCVIIHGIKFIAINENLRPAERKIVAAHELGHIILHSDKLKAAAHEDMNIYNIADKTEYQANLFAADLLLDDDEVDELAMQEGIDFYTMARYLYTHPQLLGFKLFSMANRGYNYNFHIRNRQIRNRIATSSALMQ